MLVFYVQGSASKPYKVTAEGNGYSFRMFCTCPAGDRGGKFCKHAAGLILGEVTNLREPSDDVSLLHSMTEGSPLVERAIMHQPKESTDVEFAGIFTLEDALKQFEQQLSDVGWTVIREITEGERPRDAIQLFKRFKNGNLPKYPSVEIFWEKLISDAIVQPDGSIIEHNIRPRERPWGVRGKAGASKGTWKHLSRAVPTFLKESNLRK